MSILLATRMQGMFSQLSRSSSYLRAAAPFAPPKPRVARARRAAPVREVLVGRLARDVEAEDAGVRAVVVRGVHLVEALLARRVPDVDRDLALRPALAAGRLVLLVLRLGPAPALVGHLHLLAEERQRVGRQLRARGQSAVSSARRESRLARARARRTAMGMRARGRAGGSITCRGLNSSSR